MFSQGVVKDKRIQWNETLGRNQIKGAAFF